MGATLTHLAILAALCLPGLVALVREATTHTHVELVSLYTFTKVIWIGRRRARIRPRRLHG